jgi:cytochrome c oxidase assembly factor CtaG
LAASANPGSESPLPRWRRWGGPAGRLLALALIAAAILGALPRLVLVQAVLTALLTMGAAPLAVLDVDGSAPWHAALRRAARPARAFLLFGVATFAVQMPPVLTEVARGGVPALAGLVALALVGMLFWTCVVAPGASLGGLAAGGYVVLGGVPIGVPPLLLVMLPQDIYPQLHRLYPPPIDALSDQRIAGFILLATVKIAILAAFSAIFFAAAAEESRGGGGGGAEGSGRPSLPGWAAGLGPDSPAVEEPVPEARPEPVGPTAAGSRRRG